MPSPTTRHLLHVPGSLPIEFDPGGGGAVACGCCGATRGTSGDLLHAEDCSVARRFVADMIRDITTDGAAEFVEALRLDLARRFAESILGTDGAGGVDGELAEASVTSARRADLVAGYVAGRQGAERAAREFLRRGLTRLLADLDAWDGASIDDDSDPARVAGRG